MALTANLRRQGAERQGVTNTELFFDLVYVLAVTQLSRFLVSTPTLTGALHAVLLLGMVWLVWIYTTWVTTWLDPDRTPVRFVLLGLMLASLVMSAGLPYAFTNRGLWVGGAYAGMQIGRSLFAVLGLHGETALQRNFERILAWCTASGALGVAGGLVHGSGRLACWVAAVIIDVGGGAVGFYTPGLGRSTVEDWAISGGHFAERCQAFILITLGESIVVIGTRLSDLRSVSGSEAAAFGATFAGAVLLWWVYFSRSAEASSRRLGQIGDPGRLGRSAFTWIHPVMVAGIIVTAAADYRVLSEPNTTGSAATAWMLLGGTALFLAGHAAFKWTVWRVVPWSRLAAVGLLGVVGAASPAMSALATGLLASAVLLALCLADWRLAVDEPRPGRHRAD